MVPGLGTCPEARSVWFCWDGTLVFSQGGIGTSAEGESSKVTLLPSVSPKPWHPSSADLAAVDHL